MAFRLEHGRREFGCGSTTAVVFVFSSVIMYDACDRQAR
jgi:hypothetical protein